MMEYGIALSLHPGIEYHPQPVILGFQSSGCTAFKFRFALVTDLAVHFEFFGGINTNRQNL